MRRIQRNFLSLLIAALLSMLLWTQLSSAKNPDFASPSLYTHEFSPTGPSESSTSLNVDLIGRFGGDGPVNDVAVQDAHAYLGVGANLAIWDVTAPAAVAPVASVPLSDDIEAVALAPPYAYAVTADAGLAIVDVQNPAQPQITGIYSAADADLRDIAVTGGFAFVADKNSGLLIVNVGDPAGPLLSGLYPMPIGATDVVITGGHAYVLDGRDLWVVDVGDPTNPKAMSHYDTSAKAIDIAVDGDYAYVAAGSQGIWILDISNPAGLVELAFSRTSNAYSYDHSVAVVNGFAYVGETEWLRVVDVRSPSAPKQLTLYRIASPPTKMSAQGHMVYMAAGIAGLRLFDVSDPAQPQEVGYQGIPVRVNGISIVKDLAYLACGVDGLWIVDVSNPAALKAVARYNTPDEALAVEIDGNYAYLADRASGLRIIDVSNPAQPLEVGSFDTSGWAREIAVDGRYVYVADAFAGLRILDVADPATPVEVGSYKTEGWLDDVAVAGAHAYLAASHTGLRIVDVTNPANPVEAGFYQTPDRARRVALAGGYAYVADYYGGLHVVDVTDPAKPIKAGSYETPGDAIDVALVGKRLYIADGYAGVRVVDVDDPTNPVELGFYHSPDDGSVFVIGASADYIYTAPEKGVFVLGYRPTSFPVAGRVINWDGRPLPGLELSINPTRTTSTNSVGSYSLAGLVTGTYTITPHRDGYFFEPPSRTFSVPPLARQQNFTVSAEPVYTIGGGFYESTFPYTDLFPEAVTVQLTGGPQSASQNGYYSFDNLPPGVYEVTPSLTDHTFYPDRRVVEIPPSNSRADFVVIKEPTLNVLGVVHQDNGLPFFGVEVALSPLSPMQRSPWSGAALASGSLGVSSGPTTTTDAQGRYAFLNLEPGRYALLPQQDSYRFAPISQTVELPTRNEYHFTILPEAITATIGGGVTVTLILTDTQGLTTALTFPADARADPIQVTVLPLQMPHFFGHASAHHAFVLSLPSFPTRIPAPDFARPLSITLGYSITDTRTISPTAEMGLWWLDEADGWLRAEVTCGPLSRAESAKTAQLPGRMEAALCRTGLYALAGPTNQLLAPGIRR